MTEEKQTPYVAHTFLGVRSFLEVLKDDGVHYHLFDDDLSSVYREFGEIFTEKEDSISIGYCEKEGNALFFAEFAMKITKSYRAHLVFIFDHHPLPEEVLQTAGDFEELVMKHVDNVDINGIISQLHDEKDNSVH